MDKLNIQDRDVDITARVIFDGDDNTTLEVIFGFAHYMCRCISVMKIVTTSWCMAFDTDELNVWLHSTYTLAELAIKLYSDEYHHWEERVDYKLLIETNAYTGNFERELVAYAFGTLDSVQMDMMCFPGDYEMDLFWQEEMGLKRRPYPFYSPAKQFLKNTYQSVDDWRQQTFYGVNWSDSNSMFIQLAKPLDAEWEERVVRRIKKFFECRPCKYSHTLSKDAKLLSIRLVDHQNNTLKQYV